MSYRKKDIEEVHKLLKLKATIIALKELRSPLAVAQARGVKLERVFKG